MTQEESKKFIEYWKTTDEFKAIPDNEKPIAIAQMIKRIKDISFRKK